MKMLLTIFKNRISRAASLALIIFLSFCYTADAQRPDKAFGIGFQVGNPTALALQFYKAHGMSTDILLAYNLNDFMFLNIHGLWNTHLDQTGHWHLFYGPGGFIGARDLDGSEKRYRSVEAGISGNFGLNVVLGRVELFGQVTPRLTLTPGTKFYFGGGVGLRFFI